LRHIERTKVLAHLVAADSADVCGDYQVIQETLKKYTTDLSGRPQLVVLSKADTVNNGKELAGKVAALQKITQAQVVVISAQSHQGLEPLKDGLFQLVTAARKEEAAIVQVEEIPTLTLADDPEAWWIEETADKLIIKGQKIEGFARRSDFTNLQAMARLRQILHKYGIDRELQRRQPIQKTVEIAGKKLKKSLLAKKY